MFNDYNRFPRAEMLNLLLDGGGDSFSRRRVFIVPSVEALNLKVGCCPGNSVNSFNMFTNTAMTCQMKIIANCRSRAII